MRAQCANGHALTPDNTQTYSNGRHYCLTCRDERNFEPNGSREALSLALDAYRAAPEWGRDDMLVRGLVNVLIREALEPPCTFVRDHRICGVPGRLVKGRALCDGCAAEVARARVRQGRDDAR